VARKTKRKTRKKGRCMNGDRTRRQQRPHPLPPLPPPSLPPGEGETTGPQPPSPGQLEHAGRPDAAERPPAPVPTSSPSLSLSPPFPRACS